MRFLFSCGGTGGHIYPALAVAECIRKNYPESEFLFIGANGKMEMQKVPNHGFDIVGLDIQGIMGKSFQKKIVAIYKMFGSLIKSYGIVKKYNPDVAVGFGGYASGAAIMASVLLRKPTSIQEQNSFPGVTNRLLGKFVDKIFVAYHDAIKYFPEKKCIQTSNPIRIDLTNDRISQQDARSFFDLDSEKFTVFILGGSLGARTFNETLKTSFEKIMLNQDDIQYIWQIGNKNFQYYHETHTALLPNVAAKGYINNMKMAYSASDLVVARAGAMTLTELGHLGKAALLVPSPNVSQDHQTKNAMALVNTGAAEILKDSECQLELINTISMLSKRNDKLKALRSNIKKTITTDAVEEISREIVKLTSK